MNAFDRCADTGRKPFPQAPGNGVVELLLVTPSNHDKINFSKWFRRCPSTIDYQPQICYVLVGLLQFRRRRCDVNYTAPGSVKSQQIPIFEPRSAGANRTNFTPSVYCYADPEFVLQNAVHFELVLTRRAKQVKRAYLRSLTSHAVKLLPKRYGQCIVQTLPQSGHVCYALGGVEGSR